MIAYLRGKIINKGLNYAILDNAGLGYQIYTSDNLLLDLKIGEEVEMYTHHHLREDANDLYGFKTLAELELFELLLTVSGVGPKSALGVLAMASADDIKEAIVREDANLLTKVSGIGKKTAERIVLELKTKIIRSAGLTISTSAVVSAGGDEIDALMSLGYSLTEARQSLNSIGPEIKDSGERVKAALKKMVKK